MRRRIQDLTQWHRWFAWYPITIGNECVWLEWVEQRVYFSHGLTGNSYEFRWPQ